MSSNNKGIGREREREREKNFFLAVSLLWMLNECVSFNTKKSEKVRNLINRDLRRKRGGIENWGGREGAGGKGTNGVVNTRIAENADRQKHFTFEAELESARFQEPFWVLFCGR